MNTTDSSAATGAAATPDTETAPRVVAGQADDAGLDGEEAGEEEREEEEEGEGGGGGGGGGGGRLEPSIRASMRLQ